MILNLLILGFALVLGAADTMHSYAHGRNRPPSEYVDPHTSEGPVEVRP
jgi:hypothetical protein